MSAVVSYLTAIIGLLVISACWLAVQRLWLASFPEHGGGEEADALAGRGDCHGCRCETNDCERDSARQRQHHQEGNDHAP